MAKWRMTIMMEPQLTLTKYLGHTRKVTKSIYLVTSTMQGWWRIKIKCTSSVKHSSATEIKLFLRQLICHLPKAKAPSNINGADRSQHSEWSGLSNPNLGQQYSQQQGFYGASVCTLPSIFRRNCNYLLRTCGFYL